MKIDDNQSYKCQKRNTDLADRMAMVRAYNTILIVHGHDGGDVSRAVVEIERRAFLDGNHLAFAIRYCTLCRDCAVDRENRVCSP